MAGKYGPASVFYLVDGYDLTAAGAKTLREKAVSIMEDTTALGDAWRERSPVGVVDVEFAQEGAFFDTSTDNSHTALNSLPANPQATARVVSMGFAGATIGEPFVGIEGAFSMEYEVLAEKDALTKANASYSVTGSREHGRILQPLAAQTADWDTESTSVDYTADTAQRVVPITSSSVANPSVITTTVPHGLTSGDLVLIASHAGSTPSIDGEQTATVTSTTTFTIPVNVTVGGTGGTLVRADSSNGGSAYLQVTAASGFTNFVATVRDSTDDVTFADVGAFTDNVSAPFAERITFAGAVDRYTAVSGNVTGTGSITAFCGICRNE